MIYPFDGFGLDSPVLMQIEIIRDLVFEFPLSFTKFQADLSDCCMKLLKGLLIRNTIHFRRLFLLFLLF